MAGNGTVLRAGCDAGHISSAIVITRPEDAGRIAAMIGAVAGNEIHAIAGSRIVIVMEDRDTRALSARLDAIAALAGVLSVAMVFEQALEPEPERGTL